MNLRTILIGIFIPICVSGVFALISISTAKGNKKYNTKKQTIVMLPPFIGSFGLISSIFIIGVTILLTVDTISKETNLTALPIFYIVMGSIVGATMYLFLKAKCWRLIIEDDTIEVHPILKKPYKFLFKDIVSVKRQTKKNRVKSERVVIKTCTGKKVIAESAEIGYKKLVQELVNQVSQDRLEGF